MRGNLAKAPLLAVLFAAVFVFAGVFLPFSEGYAQEMDGFAVPLIGYVFLIAYGLWAALPPALLFSGARYAGVRLTLPLCAAMLGCMWAAPLLEPVLLGEPTGVMTSADCLFRLAQGSAATVMLAGLALLLYKPQPKPSPQPQQKVKIKIPGVVALPLSLPIVYVIAGFCSRYFLLLRNPAALEYLTGETTRRTFMGELVYTMLNNAWSIPLSYCRGFLLAAFLLLLLWPLADKRVLFIISGVMLPVSCALLYLLPNPLMPAQVRIAHLIESAALNVFYGLLTSFLLHRCLKVETLPLPTAAPVGKPAGRPVRRSAASGQTAPGQAAPADTQPAAAKSAVK